MNGELDKLLGRLKRLLTFEQRHRAFDLANSLTEQFAQDVRVWWMRGNVYVLMANYESAVEDFSRAITIDPNEPALFFDRGRVLLNMEQDRAAVQDFTTALSLCDRYSNEYYREVLYLLRADAHIRLRNKKQAEEDLTHVSDEGNMWTYRLCSKDILLAECQKITK